MGYYWSRPDLQNHNQLDVWKWYFCFWSLVAAAVLLVCVLFFSPKPLSKEHEAIWARIAHDKDVNWALVVLCAISFVVMSHDGTDLNVKNSFAFFSLKFGAILCSCFAWLILNWVLFIFWGEFANNAPGGGA